MPSMCNIAQVIGINISPAYAVLLLYEHYLHMRLALFI